MLKDFVEGFLSLLYPLVCPVCKEKLPANSSHAALCGKCLPKILRNTPPFCARCSRSVKNDPRPLCCACRLHLPAFDFAWCACLYEDPLKELIHRFKYNDKTQLRHPFFALLTEHIEEYQLDIRQFDLIVPIPLHPTRQRERGYNQSALLAREISRRYGIPCATAIIRHRHTVPQSALGQKERWTNIQGAFRINDSTAIQGKKFLLVDDILTTGATVSDAARVLKAHGATTVGVLTLAAALTRHSET